MSHAATKTSSVISVVVSTLGTGILFMPASFHQLGWMYAVGALVAMGLLTFFTLYAIAYAALTVECLHDASYPKIASTFSKKLRVLVDLAMICSNIGCCVFISQTLARVASRMLVEFGVGIDQEILRKSVLLLALLLVWYFGSKEDLSSLAFMSKVSLAGVFYYLALTVYYAAVYGKDTAQLVARSTDDLSTGFIRFVFALHCQFSFPSIFSDMADKSAASVSQVCALGSAAVVLVYAASGFFGYKAVGAEIGGQQILSVFNDRNGSFMQHVMKSSFDKYGVLPAIAQSLFLFIWFGFLCFATAPTIPILQSYLTFNGKPLSKKVTSLLIAMGLFLCGIPPALPLDTILSLNTALFTAALSFVFPSIFMIYVSPKLSARSITAYGVILFSLLVSGSIIKSALFN